MPKIKRAAEDSCGNVSFSVMPWKAKRKLEGAVPETLTTSGMFCQAGCPAALIFISGASSMLLKDRLLPT